MSSLTQTRRIRVLTVGIAATVALYTLVLVLAEPLKSFAETDDVVVTLTVAAALSQTCTTPVTMGTLNGTGDSGVTSAGHITTCTIITNNSTGYSFGWHIAAGTGALGSRSGTGHLNGYKTTANRIRAYTPGTPGTPEAMSVAAGDARWAARISDTSDTDGLTGQVWGADGASEKYLNVATGSTVEIANRTTQTPAEGDDEVVSFRTIIDSANITATDTYKAIVTFTATTNP